MGDELSVGLERPGGVVREVAGSTGEAPQDHRRAVDLLLPYAPDERWRDAHQAACTVAAFELRLTAGQLDLHVFRADRSRPLRVAGLERVHEGLGGFQRIGHRVEY